MTIDETIETIFTLHRSGKQLSWPKESLIELGEYSELAIQTLIKKEIIHQLSPFPKCRTIINSDVINCNSYKDADSLLSEKRSSPATLNITDNSNNSGILLNQSDPVFSESPIIQSVTTTPSKKDNKSGTKWYSTPLFKYIFWPLLVGLIILALTLYLK